MSNLKNIALLLLIALPLQACSAGASVGEAQKLWEKSKDLKSYRQYSEEFANFNNYNHLDEKDGCYALGTGSVTMYFIIKPKLNSEFSVIEQVVTEVDNAKSQCFKKTYTGIPTKVTPFTPFVMKMVMG
jgi:hypothetical protein